MAPTYSPSQGHSSKNSTAGATTVVGISSGHLMTILSDPRNTNPVQVPTGTTPDGYPGSTFVMLDPKTTATVA